MARISAILSSYILLASRESAAFISVAPSGQRVSTTHNLPVSFHHAGFTSTSTSQRAGHPGGGGGHPGGATIDVEAPAGFIDTELRGAAMRLHTRSQAPKEGEAPEKEKKGEPYTPTRDDYLQFLVDSKAVYEAFENEIVNELPEMAPYRNTGLERVDALETDIEFMVSEYGLKRPVVGKLGQAYADEIRQLAKEGKIPELMCHYYNFYFAHTAGGRMIGKQMSALLLDKKTLEFYKWGNGQSDLNKIKDAVKKSIEEMAANWTEEERERCVGETAGAFRGGGGINSYLSGGSSSH